MKNKIFIISLVSFLILVSTIYSVTAGISPITPSLNLDGQDLFTITNYNMSGNNINWSDLYEFPVACPSGTYLTQLDDSVTCTSISASSYDNLTVTNFTTSRINSIQYVQAGNYSDISVTQDRCSGLCKVILPTGTYTHDNNAITIRPNTIYEGYGAVINRATNPSVFFGSSIVNNYNVTFRGIKFVDNGISTSTKSSFIYAKSVNVSNWVIENNEFWNMPNGTAAILLGHASTEYWATNVKVINNKFMYVHSGMGYNGDGLQFIGNYLVGGRGYPAGEGEGLDWNGMPSNGKGGIVSNNIIINFTEQSLDINGHHVVISNNVVTLRHDGATTTGINSYGNSYGVVSGNIIKLTDETADSGIKIRNSGTLQGGQIISNNIIHSNSGVGKGITFAVNASKNIIIGNSLINLSSGLWFSSTGSNNNMINSNYFNNVTEKITNSNTSLNINNGFYFNAPIMDPSYLDSKINLSWNNLTEYPVACPIGSYLTQLDDSVTCTTISSITNNLNVSGNFTNDLIPQTTDTYSLGTTLLKWMKGWFVDLDVSNNVSIGGNLSVDGNVGIGTRVTTALLNLLQTATTGNTIWAYRDLASDSTDSPVAFIEQDNAGDDQKALTVQQDGTGDGVLIDQNGAGAGLSVDSEAGAGEDVLTLTNEETVTAQLGDPTQASGTYHFWRNLASATTVSPVMKVMQTNAGDDQPALSVGNDGTGNGIYVDQNGNGVSINIDSEATTANGITINLAGTGNAIEVTKGDVVLSDNLDVSGNFTGNQIYGGMFYHNHTATEINFAVDGTYYNLFMTNASHLNGFTANNLGSGLNSSLTTNIAGLYKASFMASGSGENNELYYTSIFINEDNQDNCEHHKKLAAGGDVLTQSGSCLINLAVGENVSVRTANIGNTGVGNYYGSNLNLLRIGK